MDELLTLRARVGSLQRDVSGLEAIVRNLDKHKNHLDKLTDQLVLLLFDTEHDRPFLLPNGPPEDEIVSTCIIILDLSCCVVVCLEIS